MESLTAIQSISSLPETVRASSVNQAHVLPQITTQFASMIGEGMNTVNNNIINAENAMNSYALDGNMPTHEVMLTMEKAKFSLQIAVEVRNRLVEAYSELTRMQI